MKKRDVQRFQKVLVAQREPIERVGNAALTLHRNLPARKSFQVGLVVVTMHQAAVRR